MLYSPAHGTNALGFSGNAGLGYGFFFSPHWGITTGVELACYNSLFNLDNYRAQSVITDVETGEYFEFRSTINNYKEKQNTLMAQIPLMLQFQTGEKHQFYAAAGAKVAFPLSAKYRSTTESITNSGYYAYENYEYTTQEFLGFGTFRDRKNDGKLPDFNTAFLASFELGAKWKLNERMNLYSGIYADYGLNNIYKDDIATQPFVVYNNTEPHNFAVNSILKSNRESKPFTEKIIPMAAGITLKLTFGTNCKTKTNAMANATAAAIQPIEPEIPAVDEMPSAALSKEKLPETLVVEIASEEIVAQNEAEAITETTTKSKIINQKAVEQKPEVTVIQSTAEADEALQNAKNKLMQAVGGYEIGKTQLNTQQQQAWDSNIALLYQYPDLKFYINGHTCNIGTSDQNQTISTEREEAVKEYLLSKNIDPSRILGIVAKRDTEPLVPNDNEQHRKINRRVALSF